MGKLFAHAYQVSLEALQLADLNVSLARNVRRIRHATIRNAEIHAQEHAALEPVAQLSITTRFVVVLNVLLETHSFVVNKSVRSYNLIIHIVHN